MSRPIRRGDRVQFPLSPMGLVRGRVDRAFTTAGDRERYFEVVADDGTFYPQVHESIVERVTAKVCRHCQRVGTRGFFELRDGQFECTRIDHCDRRRRTARRRLKGEV